MGGYAFEPSQADSLFFKFFGTTNPFDELFAPSPVDPHGKQAHALQHHGANVPLVDGSVPVKGFGTVFGGLKGLAAHGQGPLVEPKQPAPREIPLRLTLEELHRGCIKKMKVSRKVSDQDNM
jgi:hypothetical protein